ncbi:hypothetical protein SCG7109_CB_00010, partial [Chlamydiales bacterium SCGC AG-110-M15]
MITLIAWIGVLIVSFYILARVCDDYFVVSLELISERFKLSQDMTGATLMAIGSSAPELFVSLIALIKPGDHVSIGLGTIIGSAIFNILVIVGVTATVKKAIVPWQPIVRDLLFYSISIFLLMHFFSTGYITWSEAAIFVSTYCLYVFAVFFWRRLFPYTDQVETAKEYEEDVIEKFPKVNEILENALTTCFPDRERYFSTFGMSVLIIGILCWI